MNDEKELDREIIHRILDGDVSPEEKKRLMDRLQADPVLLEEFGGLVRTLRVVETSGRVPVPPFFTAEVMRRLPLKKATVSGRIRGFLFGSRVLHWNMATAVAAAVFVILSTAVLSTMFRGTPRQVAGPVGEATVRLTFYAPQARSVAVAGDFNKWRTDADEMKSNEGMWSIELKLKPGVYNYNFIVDGKSWVADPGAETYQDDGFGSRNAVLRVAI